MNLIRCSSNCQFQQDGCCTLDQPKQVTSAREHTEGCCYFVPRSQRAPGDPTKASDGDAPACR